MTGTVVDLLSVLRRHYLPDGRPPAGVFAAEIESPCGKRRADALWMPTTWSGSRELVGHELKVSRSDVLAELADPTKADAWAKYCGRWWLVVADPALVEGLDVPESWGIMSPPSGRRTRSMTVLREAPKLRPVETGPAFRRIAVWLRNRQGQDVADLRANLMSVTRERDQLRAEVDRLHLAGAHRGGLPRDVERIQRIVRAFEAAKPQAHLYVDLEESDVVAALLDVAVVRQAASTARWELEHLVGNVKRLAEPMGSLAHELERLKAPTVAVPR